MTQLPKGITKRGESYRVSIMVEGKRHTKTLPTLEDAEEYAKDVRNGNLESDPEESWTLPEALEQYVQGHLVVGGYATTTVTTYENRVGCFVKLFGEEKTLDSFTEKDFIDYGVAMKRDRNLTSKTIDTDLTILRTIMKFARKMGGMTKLPPEKQKVKIRKKEPRFLTHEQEAGIIGYFKHIGDDVMADLVALLIDTGMRVDVEALKLPTKFIDFKGGTVTIWKSKSATPRKIPLTTRATTILKTLVVAQSANPTGTRGVNLFKGLTYKQAQRRWLQMREALGQGDNKDWTLHICRHTFCTRLVSGGIDLKTLQVLAGHEDIKTTMKYAHFVPTNMFKVLDVLENRGEEKVVAFPNV